MFLIGTICGNIFAPARQRFAKSAFQSDVFKESFQSDVSKESFRVAVWKFFHAHDVAPKAIAETAVYEVRITFKLRRAGYRVAFSSLLASGFLKRWRLATSRDRS